MTALHSSAEALRAVVAKVVADFHAEMGISPVLMNTGLCADVATAIEEALPAELRGLVAVVGSDDLLEGGERWRGTAVPPGLTWDDLVAIGKDGLSHTWILHDGLHYDAETLEGTVNPIDLPCIRHAIVELLEIHRPALLEAMASDPWYVAAAELRRARELEMDQGQPRP